MRVYTIAKPSFVHDEMEVRRNGQSVGKFETFQDRGEALGRNWRQTVTSLDGEAVPADAHRDAREFRGRVGDADRVGYTLAWEDSGEPFGEADEDRAQHQWSLHLDGKTLYWWGYTPWWGGARFGYSDSDEQRWLTAQRYPLRSETWQKVTVVDELPEPEGIVAAQIGHTLWHRVRVARSRGNAAFAIGRI